ncbi:halocyanin [Halobacteriales archaeon QH_8_64_26]|nr:MAG: halocyanin [Halobacteriales archaeon QH_8_64_26]
MKRRDFMRLSGVAAGGAATTAGTAAAQEGGNNTTSGGGTNGSTSGSGGGGGGSTTEVAVGPGGQLVFEPAEVQISPGDTIKWTWESGGHNVAPESGDWGHQPIESQGFTYEHTFESAGENPYVCTPHASAGMKGVITVGSGSSGSGGEEEVNPEEMGVPFQAHYVGIATILMMIVSLGYSFFLLKYGESPNAKGGNN